MAAVLASTAACTAIAGIGDKQVDPCFDGCGDAATDSTSPQPDGFVPGPDARADAGACKCPTGTHDVSGSCVSDLPATNLECSKPLMLPDCPIKLVLRLCEGDPLFNYSLQCAGGGTTTRASSFFTLGKSPTTKWQLFISGAHTVARPSIGCDQADTPCAARDAGATGTGTFTSPGLPDNDRVLVGKPDAPGCQDVTIDVQVFVPDAG
jgi:hypothetical protein